jgi:Peptidase_C39 like family
MTELTREQKQVDRLNKYATNGVANRNIPTNYYSQRNNYTMPHRTCNSSSNAMYLDWLRRATGREKLGGDDGYLKKVLSYGDTIEHTIQTRVLKDYGFSTQWLQSLSDQRAEDTRYIKNLISLGFPVVVNISHRGYLSAPRGGHVILLAGFITSTQEFLAQDPYGTLRSNYQDSNGVLSTISTTEFNGRWQGGFRTLA